MLITIVNTFINELIFRIITIVEPIPLYQSTENSLYSPAKIGKCSTVMPKFKLTQSIMIP